MKTFSELALSEALNKSLRDMSFTTPTEIQAKAIPLILQGKDLMGCAQTGTGKTAAFGVPLVANLEASSKMGLILVPTRELAMQVKVVFDQLTKYTSGLKPILLIGGASSHQQLRELAKKPRLIIATPGRLVDHLTHKIIILDKVEALVLDEADRMLDMGFAPQLNRILGFLPKTRQTLLFSATFPNDIQKLAAKYLNLPVKVVVGPMSQPAKLIHQSVIETTQKEKNTVLLDELNTRHGSVLIFTRTKHRTDRLFRYLDDYGYAVGRIHGDRSQNQRNTAISGFRDGQFRILVATDIAARGIDISHVAHVINYDLPQCPEDYVHRVGRTGRAGAEGKALTFTTPEDRASWKAISRLISQK